MPAPGSTPIILYNSATAAAAPSASNLTQGELAVNVTDKKIYTKDSGGNVVTVVGTLGNQNANSVAITGGTITGITDLAIADGGTGASSAPAARTNLGATTVGSNLFTLANPSAITFVRVNADNTVSALNAADFKTAISAANSGAITASGLTQATARLLGRTTAGTGAPEEISVGTGLSLVGGTLSAAASGALIGFQVFTADGFYTKGTNNPSFVIVEVIGGGGGGGGVGTFVGGIMAGGGGGGGYAMKKILASALSSSETVTVGTAGTAGNTSGGNGGAGGTTSFGAHVSATGGGGGTGNNSASGIYGGGSGGSGSGGDVNITGGAGGNGGGNSFLGAGGAPARSNPAAGLGTAGVSASANSGGGGAGAVKNVATAYAGGAGGTGLVIVWEYS